LRLGVYTVVERPGVHGSGDAPGRHSHTVFAELAATHTPSKLAITTAGNSSPNVLRPIQPSVIW
jgi:hypothetical protein